MCLWSLSLCLGDLTVRILSSNTLIELNPQQLLPSEGHFWKFSFFGGVGEHKSEAYFKNIIKLQYFFTLRNKISSKNHRYFSYCSKSSNVILLAHSWSCFTAYQKCSNSEGNTSMLLYLKYFEALLLKLGKLKL